jgi:hypothetical protein
MVMCWHTPEVAYISLVQESGTERGEADGHYGAWIIGSERDGPWTVEAYDGSGHLVGSVDGPRPREGPLEVIGVARAVQIHVSGGWMRILTVERYEEWATVTWQFTFPAATTSLLSADDEAEAQEKARDTSIDNRGAQDERLERRRRLRFVTRLALTDDLGTEYEPRGGGGSTSGAVADWRSTFLPPIPQTASLLSVHHGDMVMHVPLPHALVDTEE